MVPPSPITIRLDDLATLQPDHALVDALWRQSLEERTTPEQLQALPLPHARDFPTARFVLAFDDAGTCVAVAGAVLPGPDARYGFETRVGFPHPALPVADRRRVGEGLTLYVRPEHRRGGLAHALTFLSMLLPWDAGATHIVAENGAVSLGMARAAGFTDTGIVTMHRKDVPYHLTVGPALEVLRRAWPASQQALEACALAPPLREAIDRFLASPSSDPSARHDHSLMPEAPDYTEQINASRGGFNETLGLRFLRVTADEVVAEVPVGPHLLQPYGLVHGGVHATIVETLCSVGAAIHALPSGKTTVGLENSTSFLRATRGGRLVGRARPVHRGRRTQVWEVEIRDDDDALVATGRVRLMLLDQGAVLAGRRVRVETG